MLTLPSHLRAEHTNALCPLEISPVSYAFLISPTSFPHRISLALLESTVLTTLGKQYTLSIFLLYDFIFTLPLLRPTIRQQICYLG
jgi:hypothetical protein